MVIWLIVMLETLKQWNASIVEKKAISKETVLLLKDQVEEILILEAIEWEIELIVDTVEIQEIEIVKGPDIDEVIAEIEEEAEIDETEVETEEEIEAMTREEAVGPQAEITGEEEIIHIHPAEDQVEDK